MEQVKQHHVRYSDCVDTWADNFGMKVPTEGDGRWEAHREILSVQLAALCRLTLAVERIADRFCETAVEKQERERCERREVEQDDIAQERVRAWNAIREILTHRLAGLPEVIQSTVWMAFGLHTPWNRWNGHNDKPDLNESLRLAKELPFPANPFKPGSKRAKIYEEFLAKHSSKGST